jgi:hypothetical protein
MVPQSLSRRVNDRERVAESDELLCCILLSSPQPTWQVRPGTYPRSYHNPVIQRAPSEDQEPAHDSREDKDGGQRKVDNDENKHKVAAWLHWVRVAEQGKVNTWLSSWAYRRIETSGWDFVQHPLMKSQCSTSKWPFFGTNLVRDESLGHCGVIFSALYCNLIRLFIARDLNWPTSDKIRPRRAVSRAIGSATDSAGLIHTIDERGKVSLCFLILDEWGPRYRQQVMDRMGWVHQLIESFAIPLPSYTNLIHSFRVSDYFVL